MSRSTLKTMFAYLRRAFTSFESRELLSKFFPKEKPQIDQLTDPEFDGVNEDELNKKALARRLYARAPEKNRKAIMELFMEFIPDLTPGTASNYYYQIANDRERGESGIDLIRKLYAENPGKPRKFFIDKLKEVGIKEGAASTYYYKCRREERERKRENNGNISKASNNQAN